MFFTLYAGRENAKGIHLRPHRLDQFNKVLVSYSWRSRDKNNFFRSVFQQLMQSSDSLNNAPCGLSVQFRSMVIDGHGYYLAPVAA